MAKAAVCKTAIPRFESGCRLFNFAGVAEVVDAGDLKSPGGNPVRVRVPPPA